MCDNLTASWQTIASGCRLEPIAHFAYCALWVTVVDVDVLTRNVGYELTVPIRRAV